MTALGTAVSIGVLHTSDAPRSTRYAAIVGFLHLPRGPPRFHEHQGAFGALEAFSLTTNLGDNNDGGIGAIWLQ